MNKGEEKGPSMEEIILSCADKLFMDKGFTGTSTVEIARCAGCNQALVHYYFRTKEQLFQRIFEQKITLLMHEFFTIDQQEESFERRLRRKIEAHFEMLRRNPKIPFLIFSEIATHPERIKAIQSKIGHLPHEAYASLERQLAHEASEGRIRPIGARDLLLNILSVNMSSFITKPIMQQILKLSDREMDALLEERKKECVQTILRSLKP